MIRQRLYELATLVGPLARLRGRFEQLLDSQYWPEARRRAEQRELVRALLLHAATTVPHYRALWRERGVAPQQAADPDRLGDWPIVDKAVLRSSFASLCSERPGPGARDYATGGSSGTPVKLRIDREVKSWRWAAKMRNLDWAGWRPGDRIAFIWGSDFDRRRTDDAVTRLFRRASNQMWLNTFNAREQEYVAFARTLARWRPVVLVGYASSLMRFHAVCEADPALRGGFGLRGIQSSAEVLHDENAQRLRELFACPVFDLYGQREVGNIAQNSRDRGPLLVNDESLVVETVPGADADGGGARIVVTDLRNGSFPLIRYDTGDLARPGTPDPGERRRLPVLGQVAGRQAEILRAPNGRLVHCEYFAHLFYALDAVKQFQLVVSAGGDLAIRYIADRDTDLSGLLSAIRRDIDPGWRVATERVDSFDALPSGKHRYVVHQTPGGHG